ncbi:glutamate ABC transporter substrate-binding protein [Streptomyces sp. P9(2023)]|uniref:glutamate ABC transporter substrate-binding protein n=1 Tax=Streptomyces sp. P9(2023) TaxID=3064394 RepID=UPI0028F427D8|nr:glutamate ABC transporter substrate-binding protein [Streptomyces sp. P9(2023)]
MPPPREAGPLAGALTAVLVRDPEARPDTDTLDRLLAEAESAERVPEPADGEPSDARPEDPDTSTSYRIAPPAPAPAPRRVRKTWLAAVGAVALTGVLAWTLWPDGGADGQAGDKPSVSPSASTSSLSPSTSRTPSLTVGFRFQPGFGGRQPDGTITGLDADVARYLARALGHDSADIAWKEVTSVDRERLLSSGEVDLVVAAYAMTDRRAEQVDFVGPYLTAHQDVLLRADDTAVTREADLRDKSVCSATGSGSAENALAKIRTWASVKGRYTYEQCVEDLASGAVDAVTTDNALLAGYAAQDPYRGKFKLAGFRWSDERYGVGLPKGSPLRARIEAALKAMVADGSWAAAVEKNLPLLRTTHSGGSPTG